MHHVLSPVIAHDEFIGKIAEILCYRGIWGKIYHYFTNFLYRDVYLDRFFGRFQSQQAENGVTPEACTGVFRVWYCAKFGQLASGEPACEYGFAADG